MDYELLEKMKVEKLKKYLEIHGLKGAGTKKLKYQTPYK